MPPVLKKPNEILLEQVNELILAGHHVHLRVKGISMTPTLLNARDIVELAPCKKNRLKRRDIVLFRYNDRILLHRIVRKNKKGHYKISGDGNCSGYEYATPKDIIAQVVKIKKENKNIDCNHLLWHIYSEIWLLLRPVRRYLLYAGRSFYKHLNHKRYENKERI